jgi:REP element-mobilizing transposase RayT
MPRKARIDAPGALHHIIIRDIEQRQIFRDDHDRDQFVQRLADNLSDTEAPCYAWALIPNHVHLLLKTGLTPIATIMRRLLTGHAVYFNRRHRRYGHLFQNRYKSILCQEEPYLRGLVMSKTELAKRLNLTQPAVSIAVRRGEKIARENQYKLIED